MKTQSDFWWASSLNWGVFAVLSSRASRLTSHPKVQSTVVLYLKVKWVIVIVVGDTTKLPLAMILKYLRKAGREVA